MARHLRFAKYHGEFAQPAEDATSSATARSKLFGAAAAESETPEARKLREAREAEQDFQSNLLALSQAAPKIDAILRVEFFANNPFGLVQCFIIPGLMW